MKSPALATWLDHCAEFITQLQDPFCQAVFEGVLHAATSGQTQMLDSILGGAAHHAAALGQNFEDALASIYVVKMVIWGRLEVELDPQQMWDMLLRLEMIFQIAIITVIRNYNSAITETHQRQMAETVRLSHEAEQKVMAHATQIARTNRELARLEKSKTDFISIAAHELKTPLTVVQGYVDMLLEDSALLTIQKEQLLSRLSAATNRLTAIVDDLLDVSAIDTGSLSLNFQPVGISGLVRSVVNLACERAQNRHHRFVLNLASPLPILTTDPQRLHQILDRLLGNAIKYTPDGGQITVTVYPESTTADKPRFVKFEITDTGIGISPEDKDHIFDKFYRVGEVDLHSTGKTKFMGAGPGLGLSIAKGIVEVLKGKIWAESPGFDEINCPGSTFHIHLPVEP